MVAGLATPLAARAQPPQAEIDFFEARIRPVLVAQCYECHGPEKEVKGGLRLDSRQGWESGGDSGPAIVPGKPTESLLLQALNYDPNFVEMPPRGKLSQAVIKDFETWIARGAVDPRDGTLPAKPAQLNVAERSKNHWAYQPLRQPEIPEVHHSAWPRSAVDRLILQRLESEKLQPGPDADRVTLVRRLSFDLIGLPPTPEQIDAVAADKSPEAIERFVDELLASPHFGERWGRHWLDIVRFGESLTLRGLVLPDAWRFRDYVIEAFNHDRPVDRMIREHVSGDLLAADTVVERQRQCVASTFLTMGNWNLEEQDKKQLRMDVVDEQLDTIGKAFLAQTLGCARCHDHKFDPIPTKDYYALAGILRNTQTLEDANVSQWLERPLPLEPDEEARLAKHEAAVAELDKRLKQQTEVVASLDPDSKRPDVVALASLPGIVVDDQSARAVGRWTMSQSTKPYLGRGYLHDGNDGQGQKTLTFEPELPKAGNYEIRLAYTPGANRATNAAVTIFSAEGEKPIAVNQREAPPVDRHWFSLGVYRFEQNGQCFVIVGNEGADGHVVADAVQFLPVEKEDQPDGPSNDKASPAQPPEAVAALQAARDEIRDLKKQLNELRAAGPVRPLYVAVAEEKEIGETFVHIRGSVHQLGEPVSRGFLTAVAVASPPQLPDNQSGRVELGRWLTAPDNPLTARVYVNRVWHWLFGAGLVRTTDNFGIAGELPSHPELLDHLAAEFIADGWSTKRLVRRLVLSRVYQLASAELPALREADPENRLLGRMNRRRLDAECLRDAMLSISGELDLTMGGSTLGPKTVSDYDYQHEHLRRGVYCAVLRNRLPELFEVFDFADSSVVTGCRNVSTVAPQALFLMNDPFVIARARQAAQRLADNQDLPPAAKIELAFRRSLGRGPTPAEMQLVAGFLESPKESQSVDAWRSVMQAIFASIDFRYVD